MQNLAASLTPYVTFSFHSGFFFLFFFFFNTSHQNFCTWINSSVESARNFTWLIQGFLFHLQLTWGTPAGKREECSFKGKNLEVRGTFFFIYLFILPLQQNKENTSGKWFHSDWQCWKLGFSCSGCAGCPLWVVSLLSCEDKVSIEFGVDKPLHQLQMDSSSVQVHQGIAFLCTASVYLSVCYLVVLPAVVSPGGKP